MDDSLPGASDSGADAQPKVERDLDRRYTANFMAIADVAIAVTSWVTITSTDTLFRSGPSSMIAVASIVVLFVHAAALILFGGFLLSIIVGMIAFGSGAAGDDGMRLYRASSFRLVVEKHLGRLPSFSNNVWYLIVGIGILPQVTLVIVTGGMDKSPFAQILMATFVLGQFRASTGKAIWALFGMGVVVALLTHVAYLTMLKYWPNSIYQTTYQARYFIVPGLIVAFASTLVFWVTFRLDRLPPDQRPLRDDGA